MSRREHRARLRGAVALALVAALATACTSSGSSGSSGDGGSAGSAPKSQDATAALTYGYGPVQNSKVEYQPDVVLVTGGPSVVRSASGDGLTWTLDANAPGVDRLAVGKIVFATSRAVGRIARLENDGDGVRVTLAPVTLTDVIRNAHVKYDHAISPTDFVFQEVPRMAGRATVDTDTRIGDPVDMARFANVTAFAGEGDTPPARKNSFKISVGNGEFEPYVNDDRIGLKAAITAAKGKSGDDSASLKGGFEVGLKYAKDKLRVVTAFDVVDGTTENLVALLEGVTGMVLDLAASLGQGKNDTRRFRVELPLELNFPVPPQAFLPPMTLQLKWKFVTQIAFSAKNTVLSSDAEYNLSGPIGVSTGGLVIPKFSQTSKGLVKDARGVSVGISALVWGWELRAMLGVGVPAFMAGPYVKIAMSLSLLRASDATSLYGVCVQGALKVTGGGGIGLQVTAAAESYLAKVLGAAPKLELESEKIFTIAELKGWVPDHAYCRLA